MLFSRFSLKFNFSGSVFDPGNNTSSVSLKASSDNEVFQIKLHYKIRILPNILGKYISSKGLEVSMQGFVLTSISQSLRFSSMMKSYPKISNENFLSFLFSFFFTEDKEKKMISFILGIITFLKSKLMSFSFLSSS